MKPVERAALAIAATLAVAIVLVGCARASVADVAAARDECREYGGVFKSWHTVEVGYLWECDLSDPQPTSTTQERNGS